MKVLSALAISALLGTTAAFAAGTASTPPASGSAASAPAATPATPATPAGKPAAHAKKGMSLKACNKQADEKKLTGEERTTFVKDCRAGKAAK